MLSKIDTEWLVQYSRLTAREPSAIELLADTIHAAQLVGVGVIRHMVAALNKPANTPATKYPYGDYAPRV